MKKPWTPHPNLSDGINNAIMEQEMLGGVWLTKPEGELVKDEPYLATGKTLHVQTKNTLYVIEKRGKDEFYISGSAKYCPKPVRCTIHGSNFGGSMMQLSYVGRGMYMEFSIEDHPSTIITSQIQEITEL
jgi:hypothetical protein